MDIQGVNTQVELPRNNLVAGLGVSGAKEAGNGDPRQKEAQAAPPEGSAGENPDREEREEIPKVIEGINTVLENSGSHLRFIEHEASQRMVVEILDDKTGEVIRTIPSKEMLDLAARIGEMIGLMVDQRT